MVTDRELDTTTHSAFVPIVWAAQTQDAIEFEMVLPRLCNTSYESEMSVGDTLRIPIRNHVVSQTKSEGIANTIVFTAPVGSDIEYGVGTTPATHQDVTITTFEYAAQLLNSVLSAQSNYDERSRISKDLGYALARGVEVTIAAIFGSFSQIVGTSGSDPDDAILRRAWQYLADQGMYTGASWVFGPAAVAALFGNDKFSSSDFVNKPVIESATLPTLYGYNAVSSNLLTNPSTGQTDCALLHEKAIILIRQIMPTVREQFLIRNIADGIVAYNLYAVEEAAWASETPPSTGDENPTVGDYGGILIRTA